MTGIRIVCFLLVIGYCGIFVFSTMASGQGLSEHTPADKMLEFSLIRLKESVQKTVQKNERLSFENEMLLKGIRELQATKEMLLAKKAELLGKPGYSHPIITDQFHQPVDIESRKERTQELISLFQRDIKRLQEKVSILDNRLSGESFASRKETLLKRKKESGKDIAEAQRILASLEKKNLGPLNEIEALRRAQNDMVMEIKKLQGRIGGF